MAQITEAPRQKRPGGRSADVTRRINDAVIALLMEGGLDACSFQNVAARAGVERSTLYRRCPDRWPTIIDAIIEYAERVTPVTDTGSFRGDLREVLLRVRDVLHSPLGAPVMGVAVALQGGAAPDHTDRFWAGRLKQIQPMFERAIERGELAADVDREQLFSIASGVLFFYAFVIGKEASDATVDLVTNLVCAHFCLQN